MLCFSAKAKASRASSGKNSAFFCTYFSANSSSSCVMNNEYIEFISLVPRAKQFIHSSNCDIISSYKRSPSSSSFLKFHFAFLDFAILNASSFHKRSNFSFTPASWIVMESTVTHSSRIFSSLSFLKHNESCVFCEFIPRANAFQSSGVIYPVLIPIMKK